MGNNAKKAMYKETCAVESEHGEDQCANPIFRRNTQWSSSDGKTFLPTSSTMGILEPGFYHIGADPNVGIFFIKTDVSTESLIIFKDTSIEKIVDEIKNFWNREHIFKKYSLSYKRGILMYGKPGTGKSCAIKLIMADIIQRGGVVFNFTKPSLLLSGIDIFREIQPETPLVVLMEDIDSLVEDYNESAIINMLDGVADIHKTVFIATTNYPEKLCARIVNRPNRFDRRYEIGNLSEENRLVYIEHLFRDEPNHNYDLKKWATDTDDLSVAHIRELFVSVVILGNTYEDALETITSMKDELSSISQIGFVSPLQKAALKRR